MISGWTNAEIIAFKALRIAIYGLIVAIIGVFVAISAFFTPEVRKAFGFEIQPTIIEVRCSGISSVCAEEVKSPPADKNETISIPKTDSTPSDIKIPGNDSKNLNHFATVDTRNESGLYIRELKDISSNWIVFAPESEQVTVLYCESENVVVRTRLGNWCRVSYQGVEGWGFGPYIGILSKTSDLDGYNDSNERYRYIVNTRNNSGLNLSTSKDLNSESVTFVPEGEEVKMIYCDDELVFGDERQGRWCKVQYNNVQGWAWGWFLDEQIRKNN